MDNVRLLNHCPIFKPELFWFRSKKNELLMDTYTDTESYPISLNIQWKYPKWLWQFVSVSYCVLFISTEETMKEAVVWPLKKQRLVQPHLKVHFVAAFNLITFIIVSRGRLPSLPVWYYSNVECNIFSIHGTFSVTTILCCLWTCIFIDSDRQVNIKQTRAVWSGLSPTPRTQRWRKKEK